MANSSIKIVRSVRHAMTALDAIAAHGQGMILKDLAGVIGCSPAATYHMVQTLVGGGYVCRLENPVRYVLGEKLLQLGAGRNRDEIDRVIHEQMVWFQKELPGSWVYLSEYVGQSVVVSSYLEDSQPGRLQRAAQHILPPYSSAGSVVHLAWWPQEIRERYMSMFDYQAYGRAVWGAWRAFESVLKKTRNEGFVIVPEPDPLRLKIGLPVFGRRSEFLAAITIQWNQASGRYLRASIKKLQDKVLEGSRAISRRMQGEA